MYHGCNTFLSLPPPPAKVVFQMHGTRDESHYNFGATFESEQRDIGFVPAKVSPSMKNGGVPQDVKAYVGPWSLLRYRVDPRNPKKVRRRAVMRYTYHLCGKLTRIHHSILFFWGMQMWGLRGCRFRFACVTHVPRTYRLQL